VSREGFSRLWFWPDFRGNFTLVVSVVPLEIFVPMELQLGLLAAVGNYSRLDSTSQYWDRYEYPKVSTYTGRARARANGLGHANKASIAANVSALIGNA
jgi:hypothetical protein